MAASLAATDSLKYCINISITVNSAFIVSKCLSCLQEKTTCVQYLCLEFLAAGLPALGEGQNGTKKVSDVGRFIKTFKIGQYVNREKHISD